MQCRPLRFLVPIPLCATRKNSLGRVATNHTRDERRLSIFVKRSILWLLLACHVATQIESCLESNDGDTLNEANMNIMV